jgi:hypothetical protein
VQGGQPICPVCGADLEAVAALSTAPSRVSYDPGPSFVDFGDSAIDPASMPSWLMNFGGMVSTADPPKTMTAAPSREPAAADEPIMPHWLEEPRTSSALHAPSALSASLPDDGSLDHDDDLISEDDLPEWLRTMSSEHAPPTDHSAHMPLAAVTNGVATATLPATRPAWVTMREMVALPAGESLFASIAGEESHNAADTPPAAPAMGVAPAAGSAVVMHEPARTAIPVSSGGRLRLYLFAAVLITAVILLALFTQM